jgi:hypothetical protein
MVNRIRWTILEAKAIPGDDVPCLVQENILDLPAGVDLPGVTLPVVCEGLNLNPAWSNDDVVKAITAIAPAYVTDVQWAPAPVADPIPTE